MFRDLKNLGYLHNVIISLKSGITFFPPNLLTNDIFIQNT
jgi:hypothetical protein